MKLTPDVMQQIFQEKPHMKRAHNKLVPHTLSEKEFWGKYFNYEVARKVLIPFRAHASALRYGPKRTEGYAPCCMQA